MFVVMNTRGQFLTHCKRWADEYPDAALFVSTVDAGALFGGMPDVACVVSDYGTDTECRLHVESF